MSFLRLILVFCIIYAVCSIFYKRYKTKKQQSNLAGPDFLKSLGDTVAGVIFENNTGNTLNLKFELRENDTVTWSEYLTLEPAGGKLAFSIPALLKISLSDENTITLLLDKPHHEYRVIITPDSVMHYKD